jgi:lipopolysaccharide transport system permease protein
MAEAARPSADSRYGVTVTPRGVTSRPLGPAGLWREAVRSIHRTINLVRLELRQSSFGLYFGNLWLLLEPALQAGTYYFLLKVVFGVGGADASFSFFFTAVTFWRSHATLVSAAPYFLAVKGHHYVEQGFGLSIALLEVVANEILLLLVRVAVLLCFLVLAGYTPIWTWPLVVLVASVQLSFSMALYVWLSMLGVLVKDSGKFVGHVVWLWWYLSPGLYSIHRIPDWAAVVYSLNPFAHLIPAYHSLLLNGAISQNAVLGLLAILVVSVLILWLGLMQMRRFSYSMARYI